ncbi:MAG: sigma-54 dependent transcriptional regulator [Cyclobacteriaceae bacterium]
MKSVKITIIDDDRDICQLLVRFLEKHAFKATSFQTGEKALEFIRNTSQDILLIDYRLPDISGIDLLRKIKILNPHASVIIITGYSDVRTAVDALRHGAYDYVVKPLYPDEILATIKNALNAGLVNGNRDLRNKGRSKPAYIQGKSTQAQNVEKLIRLIAPTDMSVIITGETGTGKEFVANAIHRRSRQQNKPFVAIDCGAIPQELASSELFGHVKGAFTGALQDKKGSFELADGGTLFLDEIGNLSYENQIKLLRVLQERTIRRIGSTREIPIDVRLIVATNENLKKARSNGGFREDIFHRLNEFQIELSPLRERPEDVLIFAESFVREANCLLKKNVQGFSPDARKQLMKYHWYGNFRELKNVIKRAVLLCDDAVINPRHLPSEVLSAEPETESPALNSDDLKKATEFAERQVIVKALEKVGYNKSKAARILNVDRKTLYNKIRAYKINM